MLNTRALVGVQKGLNLRAAGGRFVDIEIKLVLGGVQDLTPQARTLGLNLKGLLEL